MDCPVGTSWVRAAACLSTGLLCSPQTCTLEMKEIEMVHSGTAEAF